MYALVLYYTHQDVYLNKLYDIFAGVPRYKDIKSRIFTQNLTRTDDALVHEEKADISKLSVLLDSYQVRPIDRLYILF